MIPILAYVLGGIAIAISVLTRAFPLYYNLLINKMIEKIVLLLIVVLPRAGTTTS